MIRQRPYWRWQLLLGCLLLQVVLFAQNKYYKLPLSDKPLHLTWGLPPKPERLNILHEASNNAGYRIHWIGGCLLAEEVRKRAEKHNKRMERKLDRSNPGWRSVFPSEFSRLDTLFTRADSLFMQYEVYHKGMALLPGDVSPRAYFSEIKKDTILLVNIINAFDIIIGPSRSYGQFELNMITGVITPIHDITGKPLEIPTLPHTVASAHKDHR